MPTWYARSFFAGVAIFDQEGFFLVKQVSGHHLLYYTRLYRIRGSWGSFLTQLDIDFSTQPTMQSSRVVLVLLAWKLKVWE